MSGSKRLGRVMLLAALTAASFAIELVRPTPAAAASWLEMNFWLSGPRYDADVAGLRYRLGAVRHPGQLGTKESRFWNSDLQIVGFEECADCVPPLGRATIPAPLLQRHGSGHDGTGARSIIRSVKTGGFIGASWGVEWCVVGLDRNWAYNPGLQDGAALSRPERPPSH